MKVYAICITENMINYINILITEEESCDSVRSDST